MTAKQPMIDECQRQVETCLYTSTMCFEWVKSLKRWRAFFVVAPIVLGVLGAWPVLSKSHQFGVVAAACTLAAGAFPAIFKALGLDESVQAVVKQGNQYKILQGRFRQAATITSLGDETAFRAEIDELTQRLDDLRLSTLVAPERFFRKAQKKIDAGHYTFAVDTNT